MHRKPLNPRRVAAMSLVVIVAVTLVACSRDERVLNPPVTGRVTWNNTVRHLMADRSRGLAPTGCTGCHHEGTTIPDWTKYQNVFDNRDNIRAYIGVSGGVEGPMRRFLVDSAGVHEPDIIIQWIIDGAPEDLP